MKNKIVIILIILLGFIIRIYKIDNTSLFGDELDFGYQAYSIAQTGKDYSGNFLPIYFKSLSEWKTSTLIYTFVPTVAIFGVNSYGVRLPSIIFGTLTILFVYLLVKEITKKDLLGIICALTIATLPWHIHYSKVGFESSEMLFTYVTGFYFFLKGFRRGELLLISSFLFALSFMIYRTQLIFVPITLAIIIWQYRSDLVKVAKNIC